MSGPNPKVILITGTSSGFGLLTAARLASQGHHVEDMIVDCLLIQKAIK